MLDWLAIWGVTQAAGFVFKPILEDLAKDAAKDYAKDFFKDCLKKVIHIPEKDVQKEAYGKALKEFLQFFQQELDDADFQEVQIRQYIEPLKKFIEKPEVAAILGSAFEADCVSLDTQFLARTWQALNLPFLPDEFSWERVAKRYLKKVKAIIQESDQLRPIFAVKTQDIIADSIKNLAGIAPDFNLQTYAEGLRETYGNLRLESLDTTGVYYNELTLWQIFVPQNVRECQEFLPQVYELPKEHIKRLREAGENIEMFSEEELERQRQRYVNQSSRLVWEIIGNPTAKLVKSPIQHTVILGDPGSGKSSLLQYLALTWAQRPVSELSLYPLPLLIELRLYGRDKQANKCQDLLSFIHGGNVTCRLNQQELQQKLKAGSVIALFDGIDEIFDPNLRDEVVTDIHRFSNDYPHVSIIATSRWLGYKGERLRNAGFQHFMLQDLESEQIQDFIERWHDLTFTDQGDKLRKKARLITAIQESKAIRELAGNPLLLTMMAILNRNQELPRDRPELYNQASRVLLHQWDVERALIEDARLDPKTIDYRDKQAMLRKVAYFMQSSEKGLAGNVISARDLEDIIAEHLKTMEIAQPRTVARVLINQLRTRNFILCYLGSDSYGFVHRTFLEYFCAWEFVWQFKETRELKTINELIDQTFGKHWQEENWHEVLRLICGMIEPKFVAEMIDFLLDQKINRSDFLDEDNRITKKALDNIILATNCFAEVRNKNLITTTSEKLLEKLKSEIENESEPWFDSDLANSLVSFVSIIWSENLDTLSWLKRCLRLDPLSYVPDWAVNLVAKEWKKYFGTLHWLKDCVLNDENEYVRGAAITAIAEGWKEDPDTLPLLQDCALHDISYLVRINSIEAIIEGWKKETDTLLFLKDRPLNDENENIRYTVVIAIAEDWKEDPDTLPLLKHRALWDEDGDVRQAAVTAIAQGWKEDPDTLPWLKDRALQDENQYVREAAVNAIIENWQEDPELFEFLGNIALNPTFRTQTEDS